MWELERGGVWNSWERVPAAGAAIASHPTIMNDEKGWWAAYAVSSALSVLSVTDVEHDLYWENSP